MKFVFFLLFFFLGITAFSQEEVYFYKDSSNALSINNIKEKEFSLLKKEIRAGHDNATYWFKIPVYDSNLKYILRIRSIRAKKAKAFQNFKEIKALQNQRYTSFEFSRESEFYVKVSSNFSSYFPIELKPAEISIYKEKKELLINGFYYGFAFLVILFSINYYYFFKDIAFLDHAFLLICLTLIFVLSDGIFNLLNFKSENIEFLILLVYAFLLLSFSKFANSFLLIDNYFPKFKRFNNLIVLLVITLIIIFSLFKITVLYIILNVLIFCLVFVYWLFSIFLFSKSTHVKLFTFSYFLLLFSGMDFFVLRNLGISFFQTNPSNMKFAGFIQIITLSFAVLFREKSLRKYNFIMKNEIKKYSEELEKTKGNLNDKENLLKINLEKLSSREREVFDFIALGKSNKQIANEVNISVNTVKFHVKNIYVKLNIKSRKEILKT